MKKLTNYETTHFKLTYPNIFTHNPNPIIELYSGYLYTKFKNFFLKKCTDNKIEISESFLLDILSYFIINNENTDGIIFSNKNKDRFSLDVIKSFLKRNMTIDDEKKFKIILKDLQAESTKIYKDIKSKLSDLKKIKYELNIINHTNSIQLDIKIKDKDLVKKLDRLKIKTSLFIKKTIYNTLIRNYNIVNFQDHETTEILDEYFLERVFILFTRYFIFGNANNQSSIPPSFKKMLKKNYNIKIELFGSAINTSNRYCSLFYEIEKYFGSMGNFFDVDIQRGYYEINPPYEDKIMNDVFFKIYESLENSKKTKEPLLFYFIIPKRNLDEFTGYQKLKKYVVYNTLIKKHNFPFLRYDRQLSKTIFKPIVDVMIIIAHNNYIKDIYKKNCEKSDKIISGWIYKSKSKKKDIYYS